KGIDIPIWLKNLNEECSKWLKCEIDPLKIIHHYLQCLEVSQLDIPQIIQDQILSLKGWAGVLWQLETNSPWAPKKASTGTVVEYLAVRLMLNNIVAKNLNVENRLSEEDISPIEESKA